MPLSAGSDQEIDASFHFRLTRIGQYKIGETLPGLMSLDLSWMLEFDFGINNIKAWIHPAMYQWFKGVLVVVQWCAGFSWPSLVL